MNYLALIVTIICYGYRKKNKVTTKNFTFGILNDFILLKETGDPQVLPVIGFSWK